MDFGLCVAADWNHTSAASSECIGAAATSNDNPHFWSGIEIQNVLQFDELELDVSFRSASLKHISDVYDIQLYSISVGDTDDDLFIYGYASISGVARIAGSVTLKTLSLIDVIGDVVIIASYRSTTPDGYPSTTRGLPLVPVNHHRVRDG